MANNANTLKVNRPSNIGSLWADKTKVRQTLLNLLSNACKFTQNGTITLDVNCETQAGVDWISVRVTDTGIGMTLEQMDKLFQPFTRPQSHLPKSEIFVEVSKIRSVTSASLEDAIVFSTATRVPSIG